MPSSPEAVAESHQPLPASDVLVEGIDECGCSLILPGRLLQSAEITPAEMVESMERFAEHAWSYVRWCLWARRRWWGRTRGTLAGVARLADLDPECGTSSLGSVAWFFEQLEAEAAAAACWCGMEALLRNASGDVFQPACAPSWQPVVWEPSLRETELWAATASLGGVVVDAREPRSTWQEALTEQFDDILPAVDRLGSCRCRGRLRPCRRRAGGAHRGAARRPSPWSPASANAATVDRARSLPRPRPGSVTGPTSARRRPDGRLRQRPWPRPGEARRR